MNESEHVEKKKNTSPPRGGPPKKILRRTFPDRLRAVKLHLEEGFTQETVAREMEISTAALGKWLARYRRDGEEGLKDRDRKPSAQKLPEAVRDKILELKREEPTRGVKRISQLLRRIFFLPASSETVRQTLKQEGLVESPPKARRNLSRPRFFERATPNQMWQTDIFTFRLGGKYAYLIGFMDDYSRFLVGADLFRSHSAENVLEVFRVAAGEYQPPKEMLTDNGREYVNWRGTTRFQAEMKKNGTHHFKSRPHHPMTPSGRSNAFGKRSGKNSFPGLSSRASSRRESESASGSNIIITSGHIRASKVSAPRTASLRSPASCAKPSRRGSRKTCWRWHCAASPKLPSTWSAAWKVSRSFFGPKKENSNSPSTMETKTKNSSTTSNTTKRQRRPTPTFSATQKAQAVLAVWTDRCKAAEVCRQLQVNFMTFQHWQRRAMEGMLQALESRVNLAKAEALSPRLQALLSNRQKILNTRKISARLEQIELARKEEVAAKPQ